MRQGAPVAFVLALASTLAAGCEITFASLDAGPRPDAARADSGGGSAIDAAAIDGGDPIDGGGAPDAPAIDSGPDGGPCPTECNGGCWDGICRIDVTGSSSTAPVRCAPEMPCEVQCSGTASCGALGVDCTGATDCHVICDGTSSCSGSIDCGGLDGCEVECTGMQSCRGFVDCSDVVGCDVTCDTTQACGSIDCSRGTCEVECSGAQSCSGSFTCEAGAGCRACTGVQSCIVPDTCGPCP